MSHYYQPNLTVPVRTNRFVYVVGEEDQTLAGLVPSQTFQHQRESMRLAASERFPKAQRKSTTLLCGKVAKKKKKKGAYTEGGYPMYTNTIEGNVQKSSFCKVLTVKFDLVKCVTFHEYLHRIGILFLV